MKNKHTGKIRPTGKGKAVGDQLGFHCGAQEGSGVVLIAFKTKEHTISAEITTANARQIRDMIDRAIDAAETEAVDHQYDDLLADAIDRTPSRQGLARAWEELARAGEPVTDVDAADLSAAMRGLPASPMGRAMARQLERNGPPAGMHDIDE